MPYLIDESQGPLYVLRFDAHLSLAETKRLLADVDKLRYRPGCRSRPTDRVESHTES